MSLFLAPFLLCYFTMYVSVAFVWRSYWTWKQTGVNPYVLGNADTPHDFVGALFRATFAATLLSVLLYTFAPTLYSYLTPIGWLEHPLMMAVGVGLLIVSLIWIVIAQAQMGASWRIGIDSTHATSLVQNGVFRWSRNPIFLGMRLTLLGFFLVLPNAVTFAILLVGDVLMQIQVRLEEGYLLTSHSDVYRAYSQRTRRWL